MTHSSTVDVLDTYKTNLKTAQAAEASAIERLAAAEAQMTVAKLTLRQATAKVRGLSREINRIEIARGTPNNDLA